MVETPRQRLIRVGINTASEVIADAITDGILRLPGMARRVRPQPRGDTPPAAAGCPYCNIASRCAAAYRYLRRAGESATFQRVYVELAHNEVAEAAFVAGLIPNEASRHNDLMVELGKLEVELSHPVTSPLLPTVYSRAWTISGMALDLAESTFGDGSVVEGEVREVD